MMAGQPSATRSRVSERGRLRAVSGDHHRPWRAIWLYSQKVCSRTGNGHSRACNDQVTGLAASSPQQRRKRRLASNACPQAREVDPRCREVPRGADRVHHDERRYASKNDSREAEIKRNAAEQDTGWKEISEAIRVQAIHSSPDQGNPDESHEQINLVYSEPLVKEITGRADTRTYDPDSSFDKRSNLILKRHSHQRWEICCSSCRTT